jgi:hypothetical protein
MIRSHALPGIGLRWSRRGMGVAITLCHKTEHERRENKHDHSFFSRSEAEPLPRLIQFEAPVPLQLGKPFGVTSQFVPFVGAEVPAEAQRRPIREKVFGWRQRIPFSHSACAELFPAQLKKHKKSIQNRRHFRLDYLGCLTSQITKMQLLIGSWKNI